MKMTILNQLGTEHYPLVARSEDGHVFTLTEDGKFWDLKTPHSYDLVNVPEETRTVTRWLTLFKDGSVSLHREKPIYGVPGSVFGCAEVTVEITKGGGLEAVEKPLGDKLTEELEKAKYARSPMVFQAVVEKIRTALNEKYK